MSWLISSSPAPPEIANKEKRRYRTYGAADDGIIETTTLQLSRKFEGASYFVINNLFFISCLFPFFILTLVHYWNDFTYFAPFLNSKPSVPLMTDHNPIRRKIRKISQRDNVYIHQLVGDILWSLMQAIVTSIIATFTFYTVYKSVQARGYFNTMQIFYTSLLVSFCLAFLYNRMCI